MAQSYEMRRATTEDAGALAPVMQVISDGIQVEIAERLIAKLEKDPQKYLLAVFDRETGTLCGSLLGVIFEDICEEGRPILLVENVAVLPEYQRKGVGQAMFQEIEAWGKANNCHYEILVSGNQREGAHKFYRKNGFEEVKGFKKHF